MLKKKFLEFFGSGTDTEQKNSSDSRKENREITEEIFGYAKQRLQEILNLLEFDCQVISPYEANQNSIYLEIGETEDLGRIIGREGIMIESLQVLIRAMLFQRYSMSVTVHIDAGQYREKRCETLKTLALRTSKRLRKIGTQEELEPMNAYERRFIHLLFEKDETVKSYSIGEGNYRRVVLERIK